MTAEASTIRTRVAPAGLLLVVTAAVIVPALTLVYAGVDLAITGALLAFAITVALFDALAGRRAAAGFRVAGPPLVRLWKDREDAIELRIENSGGTRRTIRIEPDFPVEFATRSRAQSVLLPAGAEFSKIEWTCTPRKRGRYLLERCAIESLSPLRLWNGRALLPLETEVRVYPNLAAEQKNAPDLFLRRPQIGLRMHRQIGKGREFEKLREYVPGDGFDEIDWKATARRGHPITRVFQVERTQEVYVVLDASRLSARTIHLTGGEASILEGNITASLLLALAAEKRGDLFGLVTFSDRVHSFVRARGGKAHYGACREALLTLDPRPVAPDFDEVCTILRLKLRRRALIVFLTELDDPALAGAFLRNVNLLRRQHLVLVGMTPPPGADPLFAGKTPDTPDGIYQELAGHLFWSKLRELSKQLEHLGVHFRLLTPGRAAVELASLYASIKQRQLL